MSDRYSRLWRYSGLADTLQGWQAVVCAVIGLGGLGGGLTQQLARLGVKRLVLIDRDVVSAENLSHQALFTADDATQALPKAIAAAAAVRAINPAVEPIAHVAELTRHNILELLAGVELIFDGLDNYYARFLLNDFADAFDVPYFYAGVVGGELSARAIVPGASGCLRCMLERPPQPGEAPTCAAQGLFPPLLGIANALQLDAANRFLDGSFTADDDVLTTLSLPDWRWRRTPMGGPRANCPVCGHGRHEYLDGSRDDLARQACSDGRVEGMLPSPPAELRSIHGMLAAHSELSVRGNSYCVIAERDGLRYTLFASGKLILEGSSDPAKLSRFAATYLGL
jgi:molybdopterin-synthase adenylyltransferase